ncbi:FecCD family ABC transporter permease [Streptodolium elevatio]|uniref:FecCD family ABC transporter permease n=1 Tax=Streptodolium elevatio TaxID=3157996 RepID=UPI003F4CFD41
MAGHRTATGAGRDAPPAVGTGAAERKTPPRRHIPTAVGMAVALALLLAAVVLSLALGSRHLSPGQVWNGLFDVDSTGYTVVHDMRLPRTVLGLLVGLALGVAGAVMQAVTRNPLADPGLLGINAGASAAVVTAITALGVSTFSGYVWFAFAGAAVVSVLVYAVSGGRGATPARLALAGTALNAALYSYVQAVMLLDSSALDDLRFWTIGSLASAEMGTAAKVGPFIAAGLLLALGLARPLNALALGDEAARGLGGNPARTRAGAMLTVTLLCGAATAACGPLVFVGLIMPHAVRVFTGPDLRLLIPYCAILTPALLLLADVVGRLVARPAEVQVGTVTSVVGGVCFLILLRRAQAVRA